MERKKAPHLCSAIEYIFSHAVNLINKKRYYLFVLGLLFSLPYAIKAQATYFQVEITVTGCSDTLLSGAEVILDAVLPTPIVRDTEHYITFTDSTGVALFDSVLAGDYNLKIYMIDYEQLEHTGIQINSYYSATEHMIPRAYPPRHFRVDTLSSVATWNRPVREALPYQDFEDEQFPPEGWQTYGVEIGRDFPWVRSNDDGSYDFKIPPSDGYYAVANSDAIGTAGSCNAYLITPAIDLHFRDNYVLRYRSFYTAGFGETATVEYSIDSGDTWTIIRYTPHSSDWIKDTVDLSSLSGADGERNLFLGFHADDHQSWASGWAVDNISIYEGVANPKGYFVYLDNNIVDYIDHDTNSYTYQNLNWGQTYTGGLVAAYDCRASEQVQYSWTSAYLYPPQNFGVDYTYQTDEAMLHWTPPLIVGFDSTSNLLSFNIYLDDSLVKNIPYHGEPVDDTIISILDSLSFGSHYLKLSALYELSNYGFPGDTGESMFTDSSVINVVYGFQLPFFEGWNIPDFEFNRWKIEGDGAQWAIDQHVGNPAGSVSLHIIPDSLQYNATLTGYPLNADSIHDGSIFLDFDLSLQTQNPDPSEVLNVEVYNGTEWIPYISFTTTDSLSLNQHINITDDAIHRIFQVRFVAMGNRCNTVTVWNIDNINVYRSCAAPTNLTGVYFWSDTLPEMENFGIKICWESPDVPTALPEWIYYDNGINYSGVGLINGGIFSAAARWDQYKLQNWEGMNLDGSYITNIRFYLSDNGFNSVVAKIWTGANAKNLVWSSNVSNAVSNGWNEITLENPVLIDSDLEYWVGYTIDCVSGMSPAGVDEGPAVIGFGDKITTDGTQWNDISGFGFNYNWNIEFYAQYLANGPAFPSYRIDNTVYSRNGGDIVVHKTQNGEAKTGYSGSRTFQGFNLYRRADNETEYTLYGTIPYIEDVTSYCFYDTYPAVNMQQGFYYKVTAVWEDIEECESEPANALEIPTDDFVYVYVTGQVEKGVDNTLKIYPNPAIGQVTVESNSRVSSLLIYNLTGELVNRQNRISSNKFTVDISSLPSGVYIFKVVTGKTAKTERVVVN